MGNRHGKTMTRTENDDAVAWAVKRKATMISSGRRMFDWENHLGDDATLQTAFEYVMIVAIENELTLEDITLSPKSIVSEVDRANVVQTWAKFIDQYKDTSKPNLINHAQQLMATYLNPDKRGEGKSATRKRGRTNDNEDSPASFLPVPSRERPTRSRRSLDPKSNLVSKSAKSAASRKMDYSEVSLSEVSESLDPNLGIRVEKKNGVVMVDVEKTFADNFGGVKVKLKKATLIDRSSGKRSTGFLAHGLNEYNDIVPSGDCDFLPHSVGETRDCASAYGHHWYTSKTQATLAFVWYCLFAHSDDQWRTKWLRFLVGGGNSEVVICRKKFDDCYSTFTLRLDDIVV